MSFVIQKVVGRQISLSEVRTDVLRIGRGTNAELRSDNPAVALEHASISGDSAGYTITDKGSITGTYVNGKPVETARLAKGDVIEIGDLKVDVQVADPAKPLFLRIVTKPKRVVSQAAPIVEEDDAPVVAAIPGGGPPVRAPRLDYAAAYRLHRPYLTKLSLVAIGLIVTFIAVGEVTRPEKQKAFMPGGLSSVHARRLDNKGQSIGNKCEACHDPWNSVEDQRCVTCHARVVHSETETGTPPCMSCHTEHREMTKLAPISDATCAKCHADLPANMKAEARAAARTSDPRYPFELLRKVTAFGVDHPALVAPGDPNNLRFNHKIHLSKGGVFNASGRRQVLECTGCHSLVVAGKTSDPVPLNYEQHCQSCHLLTFGFSKEQVPHVGDPNLVYGFVTSIISGNKDILGKSPDEVRKLLSRRGVVTPDDKAFYAAEQVVKNKCGKCHELKKVNNRWVAQPPVIRTSWFPGSKFTHTPTQHRSGCESCHKGVRDQSATRAVLMPKVEDCTSCHGPGQSGTVSNCLTCHEYHVRSKPLLTSVTMAAAAIGGTSPGGSGGNARMIDTILVIAIAILLVVVFVPVGIALYQRLKPRPEERPAGAVQRPAPLPPPPPAPAAPQRAPEPPPSPAAPAPSRGPASQSDRTRIGLPDELPGGGKKVSGTEFVQWNGMLLCTGGALEGQRFVIEEEGFYIGRDAQLSQVVVADSRISKRHVRILPRDGKVMAIDQSSTNGTFIGSAAGQRITEVQLKRGDTIVLADNAATFIYQI